MSHPLLRRIDRYLNAAPAAASEVVALDPFLLFFNRESDMPMMSYARPAGPLAGDWPALIPAVRAAFRERERVCRWEFVADLYPELAPELEAQGFPLPDEYPLMVVTPERFRPEPAQEVEIRALGPADDLAALARALHGAFTEDEECDAADTFLREGMQRGMRVYAARVDGAPVAGGVHIPLDGATEVAGIGTLPRFRRRGYGGQVSSALVADAFAMGCDCVFLTAGDEPARRLYARLGFERIGTGMGTMDG